MKNFLTLLVFTGFTFITSCTTVKKNNQFSSAFQPYILSVEQQYVPDKRTTLFDIRPSGNVLIGETTSAAAKAALLQKLQDASITFIDSIKLLPAPGMDKHALVTISVANLRAAPEHKSEMLTQATMGTPLTIFKKEKNWYYVQTPDDYLAWIDSEAIETLDNAAYAAYRLKPKVIFTQPYGFAYNSIQDSISITDVVYGNIFHLKHLGETHYQVVLPDGRIAFIARKNAMLYEDWKASRNPAQDNLVTASKQLLGIPYLWGGTSFKGVDCSGFTKTAYFMNGLVLPRDASQQVMLGEPVDTSGQYKHLQPGDLLFFGTAATGNKPARVVHVGMWMGNGEFIHASGKVRINNLYPGASNYDEHNKKRFLQAKRVSPSATLKDLRQKDIY